MMKVNRRQFLKTSAAAAVAVGMDADAMAKPLAKARPSKPNVLYIFSDQHRAMALPGEAFSDAIAPNINAFRRENFSMDTCVSNYPLCSPHRGILMSGRWPQQSGVLSNNIPLKTTEVSLGHTFAANGYHTGYIGKWHLSASSEDRAFVPKGAGRMGFTDWRVWSRTANHYHSWTFDQETGERINPEGWNCTRMTDEAVSFLEEQPKERPGQPWFMMLSWNPPHPAFDPPAEDEKPYGSRAFKMRPNVHSDTKGRSLGSGTDKLSEAIRGYYGGVTGVDLEFARVMQTLEKTGQADNTIVVYTSDHGEMMGSQGRMGKNLPYEEACRVPFMVRSPGVTPKGKSSDALFSTIDIYPTVCGLAGIPVPLHCPGRDMSALMEGKSLPEAEMGFLMSASRKDKPAMSEKAEARQEQRHTVAEPETDAEAGEDGGAGNFRGVRTKTHTYAVRADGRWCLYDNVVDPYQLKNLAQDAAQKPLMEKLDEAIKAWMKMTGDAFVYPELT